jgi:hypothetical protein
VTLDFVLHDAVLLAIQGSLVGLTAAGIPRPLQRFATARWALVLPLSIAVVVGAIAALPNVADVLTWVALILVPPGAALALGWAMRGARAPLALLAVPLLALAWGSQTSAAGELAGAALAALSCVTLGRLLAGAAPGPWLKAGIVAMAIVDAVLVFSQNSSSPMPSSMPPSRRPACPSCSTRASARPTSVTATSSSPACSVACWPWRARGPGAGRS